MHLGKKVGEKREREHPGCGTRKEPAPTEAVRNGARDERARERPRKKEARDERGF